MATWHHIFDDETDRYSSLFIKLVSISTIEECIERYIDPMNSVDRPMNEILICMYIYVICIYVYINIYIYVYMYT